MTTDRRTEREKEIEDAVYTLLETHGFNETNMRKIATAARASNETLYRWYGDKQGLYRVLIERNSQIVADSLAASRHSGKRGMAALRQVTPMFLETLLGDRFVALNKAAVADGTGALAETLAKSGRKKVLPMISSVLEEAIADGEIHGENGQPAELGEVLEAWATLSIGDLLALRLIGAMDALPADGCLARSELALDRLIKVYPPAKG